MTPISWPEVRRRASDWCQDNDLLEESVGYALAAGDAERVARRLTDIASPMWAAGRAVTVERWFDWLDAHGPPDPYPPAAVQWAWIRALTGHPADAERWADAAERASFDGTLPDGSSSIASWLALLRSLLCRDGIDQMANDARIALEGLSNGSQLRATAVLLLGISHRLAGDAEAADASMEDAAELGDRYGAVPTVSVALAERAVFAMERGDWADARTYAQEARKAVEDGGLQDYMTSILAYATAARVALHEGDVTRAKRDLARAHRLRPLTSRAVPHLAIQARLELARAHLTLADPAAARLLLREVGDLLRRRPDSGCARAGGRGPADPATSCQRRDPGCVDPHDGGAETPAVPAHVLLVPPDRGADAPVAPHREDAGDLGLPEARRDISR